MNYHYTYSAILFFTVVVCFVFSFHGKIRFDKYFKFFLLAAIGVAIPFIIWDVWFTKIGIWWFNERYTLGIKIVNLPVEECLFFIFIPFSCVFTMFCLTKIDRMNRIRDRGFGSIMMVVASGIIALLFRSQLYTSITFLSLCISLLLMHLLRKEIILKTMIGYIILLPGFLLVNGILTGTGLPSPVVNYNSTAFWNIRIGTIPLEDLFYGYVLFLWNWFFFQLQVRRVSGSSN